MNNKCGLSLDPTCSDYRAEQRPFYSGATASDGILDGGREDRVSMYGGEVLAGTGGG